ncbi:hypothetical protein [Halopseudomonas sp.]|uniref:hypothetical protein n=1 Tax=Halopseudomonas sp. TaxID=2901191 RepID=UPI0030034D8E
MIFAVETEERSLYAFDSEGHAIAACEGLDVEAAVWLFWANDGAPLEPFFTVPNRRGLFSVTNGKYHLIPATNGHRTHLTEALEEVLHYETRPPLNTPQGVRSYFIASAGDSHKNHDV